MVIEEIQIDEGGDKMYGITFNLDTHVLEDELGISRKVAYAEVEKALKEIGYVHVQYSVYVCPEPDVPEITVVLNTVDALRKLPWFGEAVSRILAFDVSSWGDLSRYFL